MNEATMTERTGEAAALAGLAYAEDRRLLAGRSRVPPPSEAVPCPAIRFRHGDLPELRWMTRAMTVLVILCLVLAAWVWFQILRMSLV